MILRTYTDDAVRRKRFVKILTTFNKFVFKLYFTMANFTFNKIIPTRVAKILCQLRKIISKQQRTAADIGFVKKAIYLQVTPTFAKVRGNFKNGSDEWKTGTDFQRHRYKNKHSDKQS